MIEEENLQEFLSPQSVDDDSASSEIGLDTSTPAGLELSVEPNSEPPGSPGSTIDMGSSNAAAERGAVENPAAAPADSATDYQAALASSSALVEELGREVEALKAQNSASTNEVESWKNQYMRIAADFENFRKRTAKEKEDLELQVKCVTLGELLSVVDNFERARAHLKPLTDGEMSIHKSYQSVYKQLVDSLKRLGVSPMRPEGKEFDPNLHEAVMRQPTDSHPEGTVVEELVRGYFLGERVLRHAMVKVAAPIESAETSSESNPDTAEG